MDEATQVATTSYANRRILAAWLRALRVMPTPSDACEALCNGSVALLLELQDTLGGGGVRPPQVAGIGAAGIGAAGIGAQHHGIQLTEWVEFIAGPLNTAQSTHA